MLFFIFGTFTISDHPWTQRHPLSIAYSTFFKSRNVLLSVRLFRISIWCMNISMIFLKEKKGVKSLKDFTPFFYFIAKMMPSSWVGAFWLAIDCKNPFASACYLNIYYKRGVKSYSSFNLQHPTEPQCLSVNFWMQHL